MLNLALPLPFEGISIPAEKILAKVASSLGGMQKMIQPKGVLDLVANSMMLLASNTPKERFRSFLSKNLTSVGGAVRDYVEECLRNSGDQYNRALQDLVNHLGSLLGNNSTREFKEQPQA